MSKYAIGLDFGTNSCRSLIVDLSNGNELVSHVFLYPSGESGIITDSSDPNLARQNPSDYIKGIEVTVSEALRKAIELEPDFEVENVVGIGVDTTGTVNVNNKLGDQLSSFGYWNNGDYLNNAIPDTGNPNRDYRR